MCRRLYKNIWGNPEAVSALNSGIEKIDSSITLPPIIDGNKNASIVTIGIREFLNACLKIIFF